MTQRINYWQAAPKLAAKYMEASGLFGFSGLPPAVIELVYLRASQINGCAFCIDMHAKDAFAAKEDPMRLLALSAWEESPLYSPKERAALAWTEALTTLEGQVPDAVYEAALAHFSEAELVDLSYAVSQINFWNRMAIAFRTPPGAMDAMLKGKREALAAAHA